MSQSAREYPKEVNIAFLKTNKWIEGVGEEAIPPVPSMIRQHGVQDHRQADPVPPVQEPDSSGCEGGNP